MKKLLVLALIVLAFVLGALSVSATHPGCCCNPITSEGFLVASHDVCDPAFNFTDKLPNTTHPTCNEICKALPPPPIIIIPPADCSSPAYKPAPLISSVKSVKGQKQLMLNFLLPCPAYSVNISRCTGDDCTTFALIAQLAPTTVYTDADPALRWNTMYTYKLVANYLASGASQPAIAKGNPGDIECWQQGTLQFCISQFYYELFEQYLKAYGYSGVPASSFANDFDAVVSATFKSRFDKAWTCDDLNRLYQNPATAVSCAQGQFCVTDENGAQCITPGPCGTGGLFGLYPSIEACEGTAFLENKKYCFLDRSRTSVDSCFACHSRMGCGDYRSRGSCVRDNCNAGECEWRDVLRDIGIGVCIDKRFSNCPWCTKKATPGLENKDAYNEVFDRCTQQKADALTVANHTCTFDKNTRTANPCDATACIDYSTTACASPPAGITLNPDNSIATPSSDACNIRACQVMGVLGCIKNRDGNVLNDCPATAPDRRACELDYFPPLTALAASGNVQGRMDWLDIKMLDKFNATHTGAYMQGKRGYFLRICVPSPGNQCTDPATFAETNLSRLNFNDLNLQAGRTVVAKLKVGENTLRYYAIDNRSNPEIIKNMTITACDRCQGPKVLEITVTPGRFIDGKYFTISNLPVIAVAFNELATMTSAVLVSGATAIPLAAMPGSGANYDYTFIPLTPLPDGTYTFTFNAKDENGLLMDAPGSVPIIVDTTPGNVTILPPDGTVLNITSADIAFIFTEPLTILNATLEEEIWVSKYATKKKIIDLVPLLTTTDNIVYIANVSGLSGGKKNIRVHAEDLAGNPTIGKASFWVNIGSLLLRLREPSWGVSATYLFDIIVDTSRIADCRYIYDTPAPPPATTFDFMPRFTRSSGVVHVVDGFDKIKTGDLSAHKLHVYCKMGENLTQTSFDLRVDPTPPSIKSAYAQPAVIIERRIPGMDIFTTSLKVQTDDEGFCAYSTENMPFVLMNNYFPGFDEIPKQSHDAEVNVTQENISYTYYVACKNTAERPSVTVPINFRVDLSVGFAARSLTPPYANTTSFSLRVETNKRAFCYMGEVPEAVITCMDGCEYGYAHTHPITVNASGKYTWFVRCSTGTGDEISSLIIPVTVDTTPPVMLYVNDSSNLPEEPEFSYFLDRLLVSFLGLDNETSVNAYYYRILSFFTNATVQNWTLSTNTNGTAFYIGNLNLTDRNKYRFEVYPVNIVGLKGAGMMSDGVTIDITKKPENCQNDFKDPEESDIDCGGQCPGCFDGAKCNASTDCLSGLCKNGICAVSGCDDSVKNNNETDIDCGGGLCLPCSGNKTCVQNRDCVTGSCNFGRCGDADPCADNVLTGTETDVDCGGSCATKCGDGENCLLTTDCAEGLRCIESTCRSELDSDNDGVRDDVDKCPNTPADEVADAEGCSQSQKFSCGDEISDGWRVRYFGSVLCDGDGAATADPDKDGLTNAEEYRHRTDPTQPDSDFDGWNDKIEIEKGTNPLDPASHPPSKIRILLWFLLILLILAALAVGGYIGYQYYLEKMAEKVPPARPVPVAPRPAVRRIRPWPDIIEKLRKIARKEEPGITDRDWISLEALAGRIKKEKVPIREDVFDRLKDLVSGRIPRREASKVLEAIRKEPEAFALLRKIMFEKLTPEEKQFLRKRIAMLKEGKLTPAEIEALLNKLRITAAYYRTHKVELEREFEAWLNAGRKKK